MRRPVAVLPVKLTVSMPGCSATAWPASRPSPVTMFTTPSGNPASAMSSPSRSELSEVFSAGLRTMVFPAASAGPSLKAVSVKGKFQGTMQPTTPIGSRRV